MVRPSTRAEDLAVSATATWMILGLFVDGWAHNNRKPETFFTPWHGLLYSGFLACALCFAVVLKRRLPVTAGWRHSLPAGYGLGGLGVIGFGLGGVADLLWHQLFGIEVDSIALISPPHLWLFATALLIITTPLRVAWGDPALGERPTLAALAPALVSLTVAVATVSFFFMNHSVFTFQLLVTNRRIWSAASHDDRTFSFDVEFADFFIQTVLLGSPVLLALRRWRLPFGTVSVLWTVTAALVSATHAFEVAWTIGAALIGGLVVDALIARTGAGPGRVGSMRVIGAAMAPALWGAWFLLAALLHAVVWEAAAWAGTIVLCTLTGTGLALLVTAPGPPAAPAAGTVPAEQTGRAGERLVTTQG